MFKYINDIELSADWCFLLRTQWFLKMVPNQVTLYLIKSNVKKKNFINYENGKKLYTEFKVVCKELKQIQYAILMCVVHFFKNEI